MTLTRAASSGDSARSGCAQMKCSLKAFRPDWFDSPQMWQDHDADCLADCCLCHLCQDWTISICVTLEQRDESLGDGHEVLTFQKVRLWWKERRHASDLPAKK